MYRGVTSEQDTIRRPRTAPGTAPEAGEALNASAVAGRERGCADGCERVPGASRPMERRAPPVLMQRDSSSTCSVMDEASFGCDLLDKVEPVAVCRQHRNAGLCGGQEDQ